MREVSDRSIGTHLNWLNSTSNYMRHSPDLRNNSNVKNNTLFSYPLTLERIVSRHKVRWSSGFIKILNNAQLHKTLNIKIGQCDDMSCPQDLVPY